MQAGKYVATEVGDVVTTVLKTSNGESLLLSHDTGLPRPYSLGFRMQGTRGIWMDRHKSLHVEGQSKAHAWEDAQPWLDRHDHPLWARYGADATTAGHGGMDFFVFHHFVESAKRNQRPQIDVYDAATWLAIYPAQRRLHCHGQYAPAFSGFYPRPMDGATGGFCLVGWFLINFTRSDRLARTKKAAPRTKPWLTGCAQGAALKY